MDGLRERLPAIDLAHHDLARCQERPEQHGRRLGVGQHGLGLDAPPELLVQSLDGVGGRSWRIEAHVPRPGPDGEASGEILMHLTAEPDA